MISHFWGQLSFNKIADTHSHNFRQFKPTHTISPKIDTILYYFFALVLIHYFAFHFHIEFIFWWHHFDVRSLWLNNKKKTTNHSLKWRNEKIYFFLLYYIFYYQSLKSHHGINRYNIVNEVLYKWWTKNTGHELWYIYVENEICFYIDMEMIGFSSYVVSLFKKGTFFWNFISFSIPIWWQKRRFYAYCTCVKQWKILCGISLFVCPINYLCERKFEYSSSKSISLSHENIHILVPRGYVLMFDFIKL